MQMFWTSITYWERILFVPVMLQAAFRRRILSGVENGALEMKAYCFENKVAVRVGEFIFLSQYLVDVRLSIGLALYFRVNFV